jgi:hypothetical protein
VKVKKEKEEKVKGLDNKNWVHDLQVEITNTSNKPIYFVSLWVVLDVVNRDGIHLVFPIQYGRPEFMASETRPTKDDKPIQPNETVMLDVPESVVRSWDVNIAAGTTGQPRKLEFKLVHLNFGDGSGFDGAGTAFPYARTSNTCREGPASPGAGAWLCSHVGE